MEGKKKKDPFTFTAGVPPFFKKISEGGPKTAGVNMISGGVGFNPVLYPSLLMEKPKFSGERDDWYSFSKDWENYVETVKATHPGVELGDHLLLELLKSCLDETNRKWLQGKREINPRVRFEECWEFLVKEFGGDRTKKQRDLWHHVKLNQDPPLTLKKWQQFRVDFELRRGRVDDWTEREEYDLIFNQLSDFWKMQVAKEEKSMQKATILGENGQHGGGGG